MPKNHLSRQQRLIVNYLSQGGWHSTVEIIRHFLDTEGIIMFDLRKRVSELKSKGLVATRQTEKYADYKLTQEGLEALEPLKEVKLLRTQTQQSLFCPITWTFQK